LPSSLLRSPVTNPVLLPWYFKLWLLLERKSPLGCSALLCLRGNRACNRTKTSLRRRASAVQQPSCSPTSSRSVTESRNLLCTNITLFKREKSSRQVCPILRPAPVLDSWDLPAEACAWREPLALCFCCTMGATLDVCIGGRALQLRNVTCSLRNGPLPALTRHCVIRSVGGWLGQLPTNSRLGYQ
jgi:hypothetical protein